MRMEETGIQYITKTTGRFYVYVNTVKYCVGTPQELIISQNIGGQLQVLYSTS
jgi:hypothetical protein